ncbi:transposase [Nonomuraea sp. LPB2021202275-12-8]|uniref:transposase n=1 Tax=Nonomuraea sp. LPB2021202275-12-8 TaxID=3120159 RepID=UPI00300D86FB
MRRHVWELIAATETGFPWLEVAGKVLTGWIVLDLDATLIAAHSNKQGASATFKKGWGFHPLAAWCANTHECLAMLLRTGSAGSNTVTDHVQVLTEAIRQIPDGFRAKIWIRIDGAGATHDLVEHMKGLNTTRRTVRFTVGWKITETDESAIAKLPATAWQSAIRQDGELHPHAQVAELTGLDERATSWAVRLLVRRVRPSARDTAQLTDLEKKTGWKYAITATKPRPSRPAQRPRQPPARLHRCCPP